MDSWPGDPYPLGATYDGGGTNFSLYSEMAEQVVLCLFDPGDPGGTTGTGEVRIELREVDGFCWHAYVPGVGPGTRYGYRIHGPWDPAKGQWCNPNKLLLDPYAKAIDGEVDWDPACFPYEFGEPFSRNDRDSAPHVPKAVVHNPFFTWGDDRRPNVPMHQAVIYEAHVKGLTARHPAVPEHLRGTFAGIAHPAVIAHLKGLGVTSLELQPVHQFVHDHHLIERGLRNYWGYNSIGFLAPHNGYASAATTGSQVQEFKSMVKVLHESGIEVILDVVYNHTAEGNHMGPVLSFKGIDNAAYYRLVADDPRYYMDYTGTGNTLNMRHPHVLQLVMDSLRYWVTEMHVDGFRFDLASTLARGLHEVDRLSAFFDLIQQDPIVSQVKLIAEPWDVGEGGYQVGNFPSQWSEWNGKYRDTVRDFWRGEGTTIAEFASRFTGSSDLYQSDSRHPVASINFVTAHDGFTLNDLVSYNDKHNEANGEDNNDGESHNRSWNCGVEGPADDLEVIALRRRQQRNLLTTLFLSQGVPMLLMGDEVSRTQDGNNNVYCQDGEISWFDWDDVAAHEELLAFVRRLTHLRADHPVFRRRRWFSGRSIRGEGVHGPFDESRAGDITWLRPDATPMTDDDWSAGHAKSLAVILNGQALEWPGPRGEPIADDTFMIVFNAHHENLPWTAPGAPWPEGWVPMLDTAHPTLGTEELLASVATSMGATEETAGALGVIGAVMAVGAIGDEGPIEHLKAGDTFRVSARSVVVLRASR